MYFTNKFKSTTYVIYVFYFNPLFLSSTLPQKQKKAIEYLFWLKRFNCVNKKFENQIKKF